MNTEMKNAIEAADAKSQYDARAKRLLGHKMILAYILVKTVDEFQGMDSRDVVELIEGEPYIDAVLIEPGLTNKETGKNGQKGQRLVGLNTEHVEIGEGLVRFDIIFYVRMRDGLSQMIINMEAQKIGNHEWKGKLNLFNIIMIGVANELPEHGGIYKLHRLLGALFSEKLGKNEKLDILEKEVREILKEAEEGARMFGGHSLWSD